MAGLNLGALQLLSDWLLLTAGEFKPGAYNAMTISWGGFGVMWDRPVAAVVVRPSRYTYQFMERGASFTVCAFPPEQKRALDLLGTKSGRDGDKIAEAGLTPLPSSRISAPGYAEAELILECRKIYGDDLRPDRFLADYIEPCYQGKNYHRLYLGEILTAHGVPKYKA